MGRLLVNLVSLVALGALGVAAGRWLRDPNLGGLVLLLAMTVVAALSLRRLHAPRSTAPEPPPAPRRGRPRPDLEAPRAAQPVLWSGPPEADDRIDLNTADVDDLRRLPGVGPVAAQRIVNERIAGGPFATVDDLGRVPGFGPAKVRSLADRARV